MDRRGFLGVALRGALGATAIAAGCSRQQRSGRTLVGFAQMGNQSPWRIAETASMREEASRRGHRFELVVTDAQGQTAKQVSDVEDLVARGVQALFLAPLEYDGLEAALEVAKHGRVPVILIDRAARGEPGKDYLTFLGSDFLDQGRRVARFLAEKTGGQAGIVELTGTSGSSVARDRAQGFREALRGHPAMRIIASQTADFSRVLGQRVMTNIAQARGDRISAVYAHNDEMALGAIQALKAAGRRPGKDPLIVSIDGQRAALEAILRGELNATAESNPRFGPIAFDVLERHLDGHPVPPEIILEDRFYDASNARQFLASAF
jgi:galactofuranose transport system substrate-binding protein